MPEFEITHTIPQSDEVEAYPLVLKFVAVDWVTCALENPDTERKNAFGLAAAYTSLVIEDLKECKEIGKVSGMFSDCSRQIQTGWNFKNPFRT